MPKGAELSPAAASGSPVQSGGPVVISAKNYAHTLSLRLTAEQSRRLRRYVARAEDGGQGRVTHQSVIETALAEYLERQGG